MALNRGWKIERFWCRIWGVRIFLCGVFPSNFIIVINSNKKWNASYKLCIVWTYFQIYIRRSLYPREIRTQYLNHIFILFLLFGWTVLRTLDFSQQSTRANFVVFFYCRQGHFEKMQIYTFPERQFESYRPRSYVSEVYFIISEKLILRAVGFFIFESLKYSVSQLK